jgi:hypothetical protein
MGKGREASAPLLAQDPFNQDPVVCSSPVAFANAIPLEEGNLEAGPRARGTLSRARQNASIAICQEHSAMTHGSEGAWPLVHPADWELSCGSRIGHRATRCCCLCYN